MIEGRPVPPDRIGCCIAGCGRSIKRDPDDAADCVAMCGKHWRMGSKHLRARVTKLRALYRKRPSEKLSWLISRGWWRNHEAVRDALAGNINPAVLAEFLTEI